MLHPVPVRMISSPILEILRINRYLEMPIKDNFRIADPQSKTGKPTFFLSTDAILERK